MNTPIHVSPVYSVFFSANKLPSNIGAMNASREARLRRVTESERRFQEWRRQRLEQLSHVQKEGLLTLLENQVIDYPKHGANFGEEYSPRRYDYIHKSQEAICYKIIDVELRLRAKLLALLRSKGLSPSSDLEVDVLKAQLSCDVERRKIECPNKVLQSTVSDSGSRSEGF